MSKITSYQTVSKYDLNQLAETINQQILNHWQPFGNIYSVLTSMKNKLGQLEPNHHLYIQPMVKYASEKQQ